MSGRSRVLKRLDAEYARGFDHGLRSNIPPNSGTFQETDLNKYIGWAYMAGARDGARRRDELAAGVA